MRILSDAKRDFITECFIQLAKFDFRIEFLKWFRETKASEIDKQKALELQEGIDQAQQMTTSLVNFASAGTDEVLAEFEKAFKKKARRNALIDASDVLKGLGKLASGKPGKEIEEQMKKKLAIRSKSNKNLKHKTVRKKKEEKKLPEPPTNRAAEILARHFARARMPKFAIYSRLDKRLLKLMLIKATEYFDEDIPALKEKLFNPSEEAEDGEGIVKPDCDEPLDPVEEITLPDVLEDMRRTRKSVDYYCQ